VAAAGAAATLHHVEVPFPETGDLYYRIETGGGVTEAVRVRGWSGDELRVAMVADWGFAGADISAVLLEVKRLADGQVLDASDWPARRP
jgi:hypothetical protein